MWLRLDIIACQSYKFNIIYTHLQKARVHASGSRPALRGVTSIHYAKTLYTTTEHAYT